ncbi:unnamed protein product [Prorocentrum cordatum]|uniref:Fatty acid desaturase domain-containing protein n=1 Tax=Prorocentrum cordatum TaxID=2364126 RepID=A0ABN9R1A2_9DINO|nr:unnamed protein product [Polarella glacialis]
MWKCWVCGLGDQFGFRTHCRDPHSHAPRAGGACSAARAGAKQQAASLAAKLKAVEEREKALQAKAKALEDTSAEAGAGAGQENARPWTKGPSEAEKWLRKKKWLALADVKAQLRSVRESRDRTKPTTAQLREANFRAEKAAVTLVAAEAEEQRCQAALQAACAKVQEAKQAEEAARAYQVEVQARVDAELPSRGVANDVGVPYVQRVHLAGRVGASLEELGLAAGLAKLAADLGKRRHGSLVLQRRLIEPPSQTITTAMSRCCSRRTHGWRRGRGKGNALLYVVLQGHRIGVAPPPWAKEVRQLLDSTLLLPWGAGDEVRDDRGGSEVHPCARGAGGAISIQAAARNPGREPVQVDGATDTDVSPPRPAGGLGTGGPLTMVKPYITGGDFNVEYDELVQSDLLKCFDAEVARPAVATCAASGRAIDFSLVPREMQVVSVQMLPGSPVLSRSPVILKVKALGARPRLQVAQAHKLFPTARPSGCCKSDRDATRVDVGQSVQRVLDTARGDAAGGDSMIGQPTALTMAWRTCLAAAEQDQVGIFQVDDNSQEYVGGAPERLQARAARGQAPGADRAAGLAGAALRYATVAEGTGERTATSLSELWRQRGRTPRVTPAESATLSRANESCHGAHLVEPELRVSATAAGAASPDEAGARSWRSMQKDECSQIKGNWEGAMWERAVPPLRAERAAGALAAARRGAPPSGTLGSCAVHPGELRGAARGKRTLRRGMEHRACRMGPYTDTNAWTCSRTTYTWWLYRKLAWQMPWHVEHHAWPNVPFHKLEMVHGMVKSACQAQGLRAAPTGCDPDGGVGYIGIQKQMFQRMLGNMGATAAKAA